MLLVTYEMLARHGFRLSRGSQEYVTKILDASLITCKFYMNVKMRRISKIADDGTIAVTALGQSGLTDMKLNNLLEMLMMMTSWIT